MKRLLCVLLILSMMLGVTACSEKGETEESNEGVREITPENMPAYVQTINDAGFDEGGSITSTEIYSNKDIATVTATGIEYVEEAAVLHVDITNNCGEDLQYNLSNFAVNGLIQCWFGFNIIADGETISEDIAFYYDELIMGGVKSLSQITIESIKFTYGDDWNEVETGTIILNTSANGNADENEDVYENLTSEENQERFSYTVNVSSKERTELMEGVYASSMYIITDEYGDYDFTVELHNDTDETVSVGVASPVVNGVLLCSQSQYVIDMMPHSYSVFSSNLGEYGVHSYCFDSLGLSPIESVSVELTLEAYDISVAATVSATGGTATQKREGAVLYNVDGLKICGYGLAAAYEEDGYIGCGSVILTVENNTGIDLEVQEEGLGSLTLNGIEIEYYSDFFIVPDGTVGAISYETQNGLSDYFETASEITDGKMKLIFCDAYSWEDFVTVEIPVL